MTEKQLFQLDVVVLCDPLCVPENKSKEKSKIKITKHDD